MSTLRAPRALHRPSRRAVAGALTAAPLAVLGLLGAAALVSPAAQAASTGVRINEVVTTGSVNDSIELYNTGTTSVDVSGWVLKDDDDGSKFKIASGTTLAAGAFKAFDVHWSFGLGSADEARLYQSDGKTLVDSFSWSKHSDPSWSRCPDGTGSFQQASAVTLGAPNACGTTGSAAAWPGGSSVATADAKNVLGSDVSGLVLDAGVLWAAQNSGKLWRLLPDGSGGWTPDTASGWSKGKTLTFPSGSGTPDDEGVTVTGSGAAGGVFVASERNASSSGTSRLSVLRYDVSGAATKLTATQEWNLTSDLPSVDANAGLEAITFVPDATLTAAGFVDASTGAAYVPSRYATHGGGVFFVGVEGTGTVYGYVLQDSGSFTRVASFGSGMSGVMELQWEPQANRMWVVCDDTCDGQHRTMAVGAAGTFVTTGVFTRPSGMSNLNNEGFALTGSDQCSGGTKPVYWADDSNDDGHALRRGTVTC